MGLELDERRRAILQEMGVTVWAPPAALQAPPVARSAESAVAVPGLRTLGAKPAPARPIGPPAALTTETAAATADAGVQARPGAPSIVLHSAPGVPLHLDLVLGPWQELVPSGNPEPAAPLWLVVAESATPDLLAGDAGRLLQNMLRAAGLHRGARVWGAAVGRSGPPASPGAALEQPAALRDAIEHAVSSRQPAMVLAMGRLAAQGVLQNGEPLGRLRGQVWTVAGAPLVVTYDAPYLLRAQADKARAWEDLCRALAAAGSMLQK